MSHLAIKTGSPSYPNSDHLDSSLELSRSELRPIESALAAIGSFFRPPTDQSYIDPLSRITYERPLSHPILSAMAVLRPEGEYQGVGINKNQRFPHPSNPHYRAPCDVVYFVKKEDQLEYEQGEWGWLRSAIRGNEIKERKSKQKELCAEIEKALQQHYAKLGYEAVISHNSESPFCSLFSRQDSLRMDAFVLYHKKTAASSLLPLPHLQNISYMTRQIGSQYKLCVWRNRESLDFFVYNVQTKKREKISEIENLLPYKDITASQLFGWLSQAHFRLAPLSDGTFKLYIELGLLGGMMSVANRERCANLGIGDLNVPDESVADNMLRVIARDAYSSIGVQSLEAYIFPGTRVGKRAREIKVTIGNFEWFCHLIRAIASQPIRGINENRAVAAILGSQDARDVEAMRKLYQKNCSLRIYVSYDLENFYLEMTPDQAIAKAEVFQEIVVTPVRGWCVVS